MSDENVKRQRVDANPDLFVNFIGGNRHTTERILGFLPYEDIERLCTLHKNANLQICGDAKDADLRQFLDAAVLGSQDLGSLINQFEKQFLSDFWQTRLHTEFGLSVDPALDWNASLAVSKWSSAAINAVISTRAKRFRARLAELSKSYPDNERRRTLLSSRLIGTQLARLITFRIIYGHLYTADVLAVITRNDQVGNPSKRVLYVSPQVTMIGVRQFTDENYATVSTEQSPYNVIHLLLVPTAALLFTVEQDDGWSLILSMLPTRFLHYIGKINFKIEKPGIFFSFDNRQQSFAKPYVQTAAIDLLILYGNATALVVRANGENFQIVVFGNDTIWSASLDSGKKIFPNSTVYDGGDYVSIISFRMGKIFREVLLTRQKHATEIDNNFSVSEPADYRDMITKQEFERPVVEFVSNSLYIFERGAINRVGAVPDGGFDKEPENNWLDNALVTRLVDDFNYTSVYSNLVYDVESKSVVLQKLFVYVGPIDPHLLLARFEYTNSYRKDGRPTNLSDYTASFTKITYLNEKVKNLIAMVPGSAVTDAFVFSKDKILFNASDDLIQNVVLDLKTFTFSLIERFPSVVFKNKVPLPKLLRGAKLDYMKAISVEQIYSYDSTVVQDIGPEQPNLDDLIQVENVGF